MNINIIGDIDERTLLQFKADVEMCQDFGDEINVNIDSLGGYVDVAQQIAISLDALREDTGLQIIVTNLGDVMSSATIIWCVADRKIWNADKGDFIIHNPWMYTCGDAKQLHNDAKELESLQNEFADMYSACSGLPKEQVLAIMEKDEPMDEDTLKNFCDEIIKINK